MSNNWVDWRTWLVAIAVLGGLPGTVVAQPVITSGPNYCCWSTGIIYQALTATGGNGAYTWSLVGGSLPPGISIRTDVPSFFPAGASAGLIGVATNVGTWNFTLQVTSGGQSVAQSASMHVSALILKDLSQFPDAFANVAFPPCQMTALNNAAPVTYTLTSGALPPGMTLSASGLLSGTPTAPGDYDWYLQFTDGVDTEYRGFYLNVYAVDIETPGQLPNATQNASYSVTLSASGGAGGYTFTAGGLPAGLTLSSSGIISGTVTAGPVRWPFYLTATDINGVSYAKLMSIEVAGSSQFPQLALYGNGNWDDCTLGTQCSRNGYASGGAAPYSWSATGLPPGMSIRFSSGNTSSYIVPGDFELWGSPTVLGSYNVQLTITDSSNASTTGIFPLNVSSLFLSYSSDSLNGMIGVSYSRTLRVVGGSNSYSVSRVGGWLPEGLSLNTGNLLIGGTPLENGSFSTAFQFADTASHSLQVTSYYTIGSSSGSTSNVTIGTANNLGSWTVGSSPNLYLYACCASGYAWSVIGGSLPAGLSLSSAGVLSGTLSTAGTYTFLISAADTSNSSNAGYRQFAMAVTPIGLTSVTALPYGNVGAPYSQTLTVTGGVGLLTWSLASFNYLPSGLSLSPGGSISGTPTQTGQFQFTIDVTDAAGNVGTWSFTVAVYQSPVTRFAAPNGNDSNPGTLAQPYLTVQKCASSVYGGSVCMVRAGTYQETVTPNSGITIMPYNGEAVTIDGTDSVANWTVYQGAIYKTSVALNNDDTNQLFADAQMMTEARWPNGDDLFHVNWANAQAGTSDSQLVDSNLPNVNWTGAKVHLLSGTDPWGPESATVTGSAAGKLMMSLDSQDYGPSIQPQAGGLYYLYRSLAALDQQGEWFYDATNFLLYFQAPGNVNPNTLNVRVKRRQYAFELSGRTNVTVRNINLFGCSIDMNASSANNTLDGINAQYVSQFTDLPGAYSWSVHTTDTGIVLNGSGNILRNSTISWSAGNGVALLGSGNTASNNLIANTGYTGDYASGITLYGAGHEVQNNTVHTSGRSSLIINSDPVNPANNDDIGYNNLFSAMMLGPDGGEIYTYGANITGTRIHHNWLHDTQTAFSINPGYPRAGMYLDNDSNGFEVEQNVLWNNEFDNIMLNATAVLGVTSRFNNDVHNNSIPDVASRAYILLQTDTNCGTLLIENNLVLVPINQANTNPSCPAFNNNSTAPGATEMTPEVQVGCNFDGCSSGGPPAVSGTSVGPSIVIQPVSATVAGGQTATFTVTGAGSPTLGYQWQRNGANISGATSTSYTTPATALADNGAVFKVGISNSIGGVVSNPAALTITQSFTVAFQLAAAASPSNSGAITLSPESYGNYYAPGSIVCLSVTPATGQIFTGWSGTAVNAAGCLTMTASASVTANFQTNPISASSALRFVPATPCRLVDTRNPNGPLGGPAISGGSARSFTIPGACNIPSTALAYSLNLTVVPHGTLGYVSMWPTGQPQPVVSTLNSLDGRIKSNAAIVPAGTGGAVSVYATDNTDAILDINGYFDSYTDSSALQFYPLTPCRVADTRNSTGLLGGPSLVGSQARSFPIMSSACGIPGNALAYSLNFTAIPQGPLGYLTVWPSGQSQPVVSTLNAPTGAVTANAAIVPAGTGGAIELFATNNSDMAIDVNGYFAVPISGGLSLYNLTPCRIEDTRNPTGTPPFTGTVTETATGVACGVPPEARSLVLNATAVPSGALGYISLWANGGSQPVVSTLNALDGSITSNMAVVPTTNGLVNAYAAGATYLILDISSYFAP